MTAEHDKAKILIVDDMPENLIVLEKILSDLEVEVIRATSGNEALKAALYNDFDVIFLVVQMSGMDGYEVAEILKSEEKTATVPIIFITAIDRDDVKEIKGNETNALKESMKRLQEEIKRKEIAEQELVKTKSYLSSVVNSISSVIIGADRDGVITDMNHEATRVSGVSSRDAQGKTIKEIFPFYAETIMPLLQSAPQTKPVGKNKTPVRINGKECIKDFIVYPLVGGDVNQVVIRVDDVTERIKIEELMIQSEKMLTVGGLAAGMAHEINNPIAGIIQNLQVVQNRIRPDLDKNVEVANKCGTDMEAVATYMEYRDINKILDAVIDAGGRAAKIIHNMLSFSRKGEGKVEPCSLPLLLDQTVEMASSDYDLKKKYNFKDIKIVREYQDGLPKVLCESGKIQQVFMNLLKNGAQAMCLEHAGTQPLAPDEKCPQFILRMMQEDDRMIRVEVEDNGPGMDEEVRKSVFEPFFTTKPVGDGTGLGLFISYFIVAETHKGTMSVESSPGKGAKFILRLPVANSA